MCAAIAAVVLSAVSVMAAAQESLIKPDTYRGIAADRRAYRVGDVLTVNVLEAARARSGAATDAGSDVRLAGSAGNNAWRGSFNAGLSGSTKGGAETSRVGELRTQLSVQVVDILQDGSLMVQGQQSLLINKENQRITLSGIVRPDDILADNTVWSHRLANARVEFNGKGAVAESQRQSLAYRVLKWMGLL